MWNTSWVALTLLAHSNKETDRSQFIRGTSTITHTKFTNITSCSPYFKTFFIIQVYKNISSFTHRLHSNIGKIICKNVNNIFHIQNFGNFKTDFFLNLYLRIFLVKQVSSKNCSFYGLPL